MVILSSHASILSETKTRHAGRWLSLKEDTLKKIKDLVVIPAGTTIDYPDTPQCPGYIPKDPKTMLQICVNLADDATKSMKIEFRNPNNIFELEFSNIDINDPSSDIKIDDYVKEFNESLKQLVLVEADRKQLIEKGINDALTDLKVEGAQVTDALIKYNYKGKENSINYSMTGDLLQFNTDFFSDSIDLNIPLKGFIEMETKKLVKEIVDHLYQMQRFALSDGEAAAQSIKELSCEKIWKDTEAWKTLTDRMTVNELSTNIDAANFGVTVATKENDKSMSIKCAPLTVGSFTLIQLTADFQNAGGKIDPVVQTFLGKSLYNLMPVVVSFLNDLTTFTVRVIAKENKEEKNWGVQSETPQIEQV